MQEQLNAIKAAVRAIEQAERERLAAREHKRLYLIWRGVESGTVRNAAEVVGTFYGTWEEADAMIDQMNREDRWVKEGYGRLRNGYCRTECFAITAGNFAEFCVR